MSELRCATAGAPVPLPAALTALGVCTDSRHGKIELGSLQGEIYSAVNESRRGRKQILTGFLTSGIVLQRGKTMGKRKR